MTRHSARLLSAAATAARRARLLRAAVVAAAVVSGGAAQAEIVLPATECIFPNVERLASLIAGRAGLKVRVRAVEEQALLAGVTRGTVPLAFLCGPLPGPERSGMETHLVGYDGIAVIVNGRNPVADLERARLAGIYAQRIASWKDAGGGGDKPIVRIVKEARNLPRGPLGDLLSSPEGADSGAHVVNADLPAILFVAVDPYAIGYVGIAEAALLISEGARVKTVAIDGKAPSPEQVRSGAYPLAWPVYLVANRSLPGPESRLKAFLLGQEGRRALAEAGMLPARDGMP